MFVPFVHIGLFLLEVPGGYNPVAVAEVLESEVAVRAVETAVKHCNAYATAINPIFAEQFPLHAQ